MANMRSIFRTSFISISVLLLSGAFPLVAVADATTSDDSCTVPSSSAPGVHQPTGAEAVAYTYQCPDSATYPGEWLSAHYVYDPSTQTTTALTPTVYTYDKTTGLYDYSTWIYNTREGAYDNIASSTSTPPAGSVVVGAPAPVVSDPTSGSDDGDGNGGTGPDSTNSSNSSTNNTIGITNNTNGTINNTLTGVATSGNASITGDTLGGNATSGDSQNIANVVNMLQSSGNTFGLNGNVTTFTANINGDVNGDLLLNPSMFGNVQNTGPDSTNATNNTTNNNLTVNDTTNASINNNINLNSTTGSATVANNTTGGNATSGTAQAIANVVNLLNSAVSSGKSFLGVININGNLNGNIVVPPDFVNQLLADNVPTVSINTGQIADTGPSSTNSSNNTTNNNLTATQTNNEGINNQINSTATSGSAAVSGNTSGGSATSGSASSNITAFNLTGSDVIGSNDLLVFVNVLGQWYGMIMNAPGATAAEIGGGITSTGPDSTNTTNNTTNNNATENTTNNESINNNITTNASTGDASVTGNTTGGSATSGNAKSAVNLLNIEGSNLSLANWFGILFINVFGTWNGSFGDQTSSAPTAAATSSSATPAATANTVNAAIKVFGFRPTAPARNFGTVAVASSSDLGGTVLAAHTTKSNTPSTPQLQQTAHRNFTLPLIGLGFSAAILGSERIFSRRRA